MPGLFYLKANYFDTGISSVSDMSNNVSKEINGKIAGYDPHEK